MSIVKAVTNRFTKYIREYENQENIEIEIEIPYSTNLTSIFNNEDFPELFIEISYFNEKEKYKYRKRVPISYMAGYETKIADIKTLTDDPWEKKVHIINEVDDYNFRYKISSEEIICEYNELLNYDFVYYLVVRFTRNTLNFIIDFKIKYFIGKEYYNDQIIKFLNSPKNYQRSPRLSFELEYNKNNIHLEENFTELFNRLLGDNIIDYKFPNDIRFKKTYEIMEITPEVKNSTITPKFDGIPYKFRFKEHKFILSAVCENGFFKEYTFNSFAKGEIFGQCELIKNKDNIVYICIFQCIVNNKNIPMNDFNKYITVNKDDEFQIYLKKEYPMSMKDKLFNATSYEGFDTDGIIIITDTKDYKFKSVKTVDYLFHALMSYGGISYNTVKNTIYFKNISLLNDKYIDGNIILEVQLSNKLQIDKSAPVIYITSEGNKYIYPIFLIIEFFNNKDKIPIFKDVRKYKSDKSYINRKYIGNPLEVGNMLLGNQNTVIKNVKILNKDTLNKNYWNPNIPRTSLNTITNFVKTQIIALYHNHILNGRRFNVLDIDMGRGGDMCKHFYAHTNIYVGTDANQLVIEDAKQRYDNMFGSAQVQQGKNKTNFNFQPIAISILHPNYKKYVNQVKTFDAICWFLAMHYSYCNENKLTILYNINRLSKIGTIFTTILFDGEKIKNLSLPYICDIGKDSKYIIEEGGEEGTINVTHPAFGKQEEHIVNLTEFSIEMSNIGFKKIEMYTFNDVLLQTFKVFDGPEVPELNSSTAKIIGLMKDIYKSKDYDYTLMDLFTVIKYKKVKNI